MKPRHRQTVTLTAIAELTATMAVGSGALLGVAAMDCMLWQMAKASVSWFAILFFGLGGNGMLVFVIKYCCDELKQECQRYHRKSNDAAMPPKPSAVCDSVTKSDASLIELVSRAPSVGESKAGSDKSQKYGYECNLTVHKKLATPNEKS